METYLNRLLQDPAADGADKVFINVPLKACYIIPHRSSPAPEPCGRDKTGVRSRSRCPELLLRSAPPFCSPTPCYQSCCAFPDRCFGFFPLSPGSVCRVEGKSSSRGPPRNEGSPAGRGWFSGAEPLSGSPEQRSATPSVQCQEAAQRAPLMEEGWGKSLCSLQCR